MLVRLIADIGRYLIIAGFIIMREDPSFNLTQHIAFASVEMNYDLVSAYFIFVVVT